MVMGVDGNLELGKNVKCFDRIAHARTFEYPGMTVAEMKVELLENFAGHLRAGDPLRCTPRDAVQALAVVEACYRSAANRGAVQTPEAE
jgi:predicted dehydrogenase